MRLRKSAADPYFFYLRVEKKLLAGIAKMIVQGMGHSSKITNRSQLAERAKRRDGNIKTAESPQDTVDLSINSTDREALLRDIKKRIKKGYYNSDSVLEDLSHGFAKILDASA